MQRIERYGQISEEYPEVNAPSSAHRLSCVRQSAPRGFRSGPGLRQRSSGVSVIGSPGSRMLSGLPISCAFCGARSPSLFCCASLSTQSAQPDVSAQKSCRLFLCFSLRFDAADAILLIWGETVLRVILTGYPDEARKVCI